MNLRPALVALLAIFLLAPATTASHGVTYTYVAAGGDAIIYDCDGEVTGMVIGGGCASVGADSTVTVTAYDATGLVVGMYVSFRDTVGLESNEIGFAVVCGSGTLEIPEGTGAVSIFLDQAFGVLDCGVGAGPATTGTLDIAFG